MDRRDTKNLKRRYLFWLYKTTKEAFDKIERKFTQLEIDRFILKELRRLGKTHAAAKFIENFNNYIRNKEKDGQNLKYKGGKLSPHYYFLLLKLKSIEKAIVKELGRSGLGKIKSAYEDEMQKRILEERQEKV